MTGQPDGGPPSVVFVGGTPRGRKVFELLLRRDVVPVGVFVMCEDDHEPLRASAEIEGLATSRGIPVKLTKRLSDADVAVIRDTYRADLIVMVGWRTIIPARVYNFPPLGCVGIHDSPLPRYRGFAPPNWAIINGETDWGVTLMHIAEGVDEGDIIGLERFAVPARATAPELYEIIVDATVRLMDQHLSGLLAGSAPRTAQDHARATYACARTPDDGRIDWSGGTDTIDRLIRGLMYPYPGAWTTWKGERMTIWRADPLVPAPVYEGRIPGRVVVLGGGYVDVLTGDGVLRIREVGDQDGGRRAASEVIRSVKTSLI